MPFCRTCFVIETGSRSVFSMIVPEFPGDAPLPSVPLEGSVLVSAFSYVLVLELPGTLPHFISSARAMVGSIPIIRTRQSRMLSSLFVVFCSFMLIHLLLFRLFRPVRQAVPAGRPPLLPQRCRAPAMFSRRQCTGPGPHRSGSSGHTPACRRRGSG